MHKILLSLSFSLLTIIGLFAQGHDKYGWLTLADTDHGIYRYEVRYVSVDKNDFEMLRSALSVKEGVKLLGYDSGQQILKIRIPAEMSKNDIEYMLVHSGVVVDYGYTKPHINEHEMATSGKVTQKEQGSMVEKEKNAKAEEEKAFEQQKQLNNK